MRAQLCVVEEKSGEEVDIRPMRFFCPIFFCFLVRNPKTMVEKVGKETLTCIYHLCV